MAHRFNLPDELKKPIYATGALDDSLAEGTALDYGYDSNHLPPIKPEHEVIESVWDIAERNSSPKS